MKIYQKLLCLGIISFLSLASCSKESEPNFMVEKLLPPLSSSSELAESVELETLRVEAGATQDDSELRAIFNVATDGSGKLTGLHRIGSGDYLTVRVFVYRHEGPGGSNAITVRDLNFKKDTGRNYAFYTGELDVPVRTAHTIKYTIAAALMSNSLSPAEGSFHFTFDRRELLKYMVQSYYPYASMTFEDGADKLFVNMPYITDWQDFPRSTTNAPTKIILKFKPFGTIHRMRVYNDTDRDLEFGGLSLESNAYVSSGLFNFSEGVGTPSWEPGYNRASLGSYLYETKFDTDPVTGKTLLPPRSYTPWQYRVVFPLETSEEVRTVGRLVLKAQWESVSDRDIAPLLFGTSEKMPSNSSISTTFVYSDTPLDDSAHDPLRVRPPVGSARRPEKLAIEYVAERSFNTSGTGFVSNDFSSYNPEVGYFSYVDAVEKFGNIQVIDGHKYSMPTRSEMNSVFPSDMPFWGTPTGSGTSYERLNLIESGIKIGTETSSYLADYKLKEGYILYAIRFQDATDKHRTAFRYRTIGERGYNQYTQIDCIWLGASAHTIDDIAKPSFWEDRQTEIVSRKFPYYGIIAEPNLPIEGLNQYSNYWTSTTMSPGRHGLSYSGRVVTTNSDHVISFEPIYFGLDKNFQRFPVRPFIRD